MENLSRYFQGGYVPSFDNKYVQYRLMKNTWSTTVSDWQGVDDEPAAGSENLVKSGGVFSGIDSMVGNLEKVIFVANPINCGTIGGNATEQTDTSWLHARTRCLPGETFDICGQGGSAYRLWCTTDSRGVVKRNSTASLTASTPITIEIEDGESYLIVNTKATYTNHYLRRISLDKCTQAFLNNFVDVRKFIDMRSIFCLYGRLDINGGYASDSSYNTLATDYIRVGGGDVLKYKVVSYYNNYGGIYCYNKYKNYIGRYTTGTIGGNQYIEGSVSVSELPEGTMYIRCFKLKSDDCYLFGTRSGITDTEPKGILIPSNVNIPRIALSLTSNPDINEAIEELHGMGGGVLQILSLNTLGASIEFKYSDVELQGLGPTYTTIGTGNTMPSIIVSEGITARISNIGLNSMYKCTKSSKLICSNVVITPNNAISNEPIVINGFAPSVYYIAASDSHQAYKNSCFEIVTENATTAINTALTNYSEVYLSPGTYNHTLAISLNSDNKLIGLDKNGNVKLYRNPSNSATILPKNATTENTYIENIWCNSYVRLDNNGAHNGHLVNCWIRGESTNSYIRNAWQGKRGDNEIRLGSGLDVDTISAALDLFTKPYGPNQSGYNTASDVHYYIGVYGKVEDTIEDSVYIQHSIEMIGKTDDAEMAFTVNGAFSAIRFTEPYSENNSHIKDIIFSMYGVGGGWQYAAVYVQARGVLFENCQFLNYHTCADTRDSSIGDEPNTTRDGDRKHGCLIDTDFYDDDCHTEFRNCKAVGSPYGFKNCRGFYVVKGSPKFYDCVGIGGGIGRYGYGWVLHYTSKAYLYNCIGIGSQFGWGLCNGIQFQMNTESKLFNCIGIAGTGYKHISNGGTDIQRYEPSPGVYELSEGSHGFGGYGTVHPTLINCVGYAGDGEDSYGFFCGYETKPEVIGGYFGKDTKTILNVFAKDSGHYYMTLNVGNDNRPVELQGIGFRDTLANMPTGQKVVIKLNGIVICEATEAVQQQNPPILYKYVNATDTVTCHVVDSNGEDVNSDLHFSVVIRYKVSNSMASLYIDPSANPQFHGCKFGGNDFSDGIIVNAPSENNYLIDSCKVETSNNKCAVKSTNGNKAGVKVVNCLFTTSNIDGITSFATVNAIGSNMVIQAE